MSKCSPVLKKRKLDSGCQYSDKSTFICHFFTLPEEIITHILSYIGTDVGDRNPSDDIDIVDNIDLGNSTKYKFQLSLVCSTFNYLIKKPASWQKNAMLTIYPKGRTVPIAMAGGLRINGILFANSEAVQALQKLIEVACIKQIVVVNINHWGMNDDSQTLREGILHCFQKNEERLKRTVEKITLHGLLNRNKTKDLVLWLCNSFVNLRSVDLTIPIDGIIGDQTFQLNFEDTGIRNCPLEKVILSRLQNSPHLLNILEGKPIKELVIKIQWYMQNGTQRLIEISNKIVNNTLQKLVIVPFGIDTGVMHVHINQWLGSVRPEVLCNLKHLEFDQVFVSDIENLSSVLTTLPQSLVYLKIDCYNLIPGNRIQVFRFLSHVVMAFFKTTTIEKAEINLHTVTLVDESRFKRYRKFAHKQWQGISVEQTILAADGLNYRFGKYGRYLDICII